MKSLIALGLLWVALPGCSPPPSRWETRGDRLLGIGTERAEDPVSGVLVAKKDAVHREYRGTTYYFESTENASTFMNNPAEYALPESEGRVDLR